MSGVAPKDRTKRVQSVAAGTRQGHTWDMSTEKGTHSRHLRCLMWRARRRTKAQSGSWGVQTRLRDNLAVYWVNIYTHYN